MLLREVETLSDGIHPVVVVLVGVSGVPPVARYIRIIDLAFALAAKSSKEDS
jgi:hypothetical protein